MNQLPCMTKEGIGHLRHIQSLAGLLPGDWSGMGSDWWDIGEGAQQYELAFMAYTLGLVQHRYTPAYRGLCQPAIERLIGKMLLPDIWERWINASRGGKVVDPDQEALYEGWIDPIKKYNIMYKGHLLQMASMHEALYATGQYVRPGAFTFRFNAATWGNGSETFIYDLSDVARIVHNEYVESNYEGVQCEPNRVFPMCNQHALLGLLHYDQAFGTGYAADVMPKFKEAWLRKGYTDMETGSHMHLRFVRQDQVFPGQAPWADGWTGIFMHAWDRSFVQSLYPLERETHLEHLLAGKEHEKACCAMVPTPAKIGFGMFTALAAEVNDRDGRDRLLAYADRNYSPTWKNGAFYYPRNDSWLPDAKGNSAGIDVLTANALLPMARLNDGDGFWSLYNAPITQEDRLAPYFGEIDQDIAGVAAAHFDATEGALHLTLCPSWQPGEVEFAIKQLDASRRYTVRQDDTIIGTLSAGNTGPRASWPEASEPMLRINASRQSTLVIAPAH